MPLRPLKPRHTVRVTLTIDLQVRPETWEKNFTHSHPLQWYALSQCFRNHERRIEDIKAEIITPAEEK